MTPTFIAIRAAKSEPVAIAVDHICLVAAKQLRNLRRRNAGAGL